MPSDRQPPIYDASQIKTLKGVEAVRKRPGMFIGDTGIKGMHRLVYEVVENSIDEVMAGFCKNIYVRIHKDQSLSVSDDGRGIPAEFHEEAGKSALEVVMTYLHKGAKFDQNIYRVAGGLHGVGLTAVNALSLWLEVQTWRDGVEYFQKYKRGKPITEVENRGKTNRQGTKIRFQVDPDIFGNLTFSFDAISKRMRELAFLNKGVNIVLTDERTNKEEVFKYEGGIKEFVEYLNQNKGKLHDVIYFERTLGNICTEIAIQYNNGYDETLFCFANNINTYDGGTHLSGFRTALTRAFNHFAKKHNIIREKDPLPGGEDYREGLTSVISVKLPNPQFESQTKVKLTNPEVEGVCSQITYEGIIDYLEANKHVAKAAIQKALVAYRARQAARQAKELIRRKGPLASGSLPGKLADCVSKSVHDTELFIVEGESAGGSAKQARDRNFQAILPIKGKILNVEKVPEDRVLKSEEIRTLILAIGTSIRDDFDMSKLRYGKIIIMTDADVDGSHIRTLLLTFFLRNMRKIIEDNRLFIAQAPLYRIKRKGREDYIYSEKDFTKVLIDLGTEGVKLEIIEKNKKLSSEELKKVVNLIFQIEESSALISGKGVSFEEFLRKFDKSRKKLPVCFVQTKDTRKYFYSESARQKFINEIKQKSSKEIRIVMDEIGEEQDIVYVVEFHGLEQIDKAIEELIEIGFNFSHYFDETKDRYVLIENGQRIKIKCIRNILKHIRKIGQKGLEVQRFKGLGEMNPEQLWQTTMCPKTRTLKLVSLEDAVRADRMFSTLMGSEVEPRREFIEKHAHEVKNLDLF